MNTKDINENIALIEQSLAWAEKFNVQAFPADVFKTYKRKLSKISEAVSDGELTSKKTSSKSKKENKDVLNSLSVIDVVKALVDTYYTEISVDEDSCLQYDVINQKVKEFLPQAKSQNEQSFITEDDIFDLGEYIHQEIGSKAANVYQSDFCKMVAPEIKNIASESWGELFSFLWNKNSAFTRLFDSLILKLGAKQAKSENAEDSELELKQIRDEIVTRLQVFHKAEKESEKNQKLQKTIGDIRAMLDLNIGNNQELFGKILDGLMVQVDSIRKVIYDVLVLDTEEPKTNSAIQLIRRQCEIDVKDTAENNIEKLISHYSLSQEELEKMYAEQGFSINDVISLDKRGESSADVVAKHVVEYWMQYINNNVQVVGKMMPHTEEISYALLMLFQYFNVSKVLADGVAQYQSKYGNRDSVNAIADFITFELNKFVSTFGRAYMGFDAVKTIQEKASACNVKIADVSPLAMNSQFKRMDAKQALTVLEQSSKIDFDNMVTLLNFSFWDNFPKWENFITMGLLYVGEIGQTDKEANKQIAELIQKGEKLYID